MADKNFRDELCNLINRHSQENDSDTPDFILAEYLTDCLEATKRRTEWYEPKSDIPASTLIQHLLSQVDKIKCQRT